MMLATGTYALGSYGSSLNGRYVDWLQLTVLQKKQKNFFRSKLRFIPKGGCSVMVMLLYGGLSIPAELKM